MGTELNRDTQVAVSALRTRLPWLDPGTAELLVALAEELARAHPRVVALVLFGSLSRHEERPLGAPHPSDLDLLVLVEPSSGPPRTRLRLEDKLALYHTIGEREYLHRRSALRVQAVLAEHDLADWDAGFVANVAHDGVLLWVRGTLPEALAPVVARGAVLAPLSAGRETDSV